MADAIFDAVAQEYRPCPFCAALLRRQHHADGEHYIYHTGNACLLANSGWWETSAFRAQWNQRTSLAAPDQWGPDTALLSAAPVAASPMRRDE